MSHSLAGVVELTVRCIECQGSCPIRQHMMGIKLCEVDGHTKSVQ